MGKSINLTPREKPKKKQDKYSEISSIKAECTYNINDTLIYLGLVIEYKGQQCSVIKRKIRKQNEYYRVKFEDGEEADTSFGFLKTLEEYEQWLLDQNVDNDNAQNDMSEIEKKIIESGLESYKNYVTCHSPISHYENKCHECCYESRCVYRKKYKYDKFKND